MKRIRQNFLNELGTDITWLDRQLANAIFFDLETGGLDPATTGIYEAAATARQRGGAYKTVLNTLVNPMIGRFEEGKFKGERIGFADMSIFSQQNIVGHIEDRLKEQAKAGLIAKDVVANPALLRERAYQLGEEWMSIAGGATPSAEFEGLLGVNFGKPGVHPRQMAKDLFNEIKGKDLWIHNLPFERRFLGSLMTSDEFAKVAKDIRLQSFGVTRDATGALQISQDKFYTTSRTIEELHSQTFAARGDKTKFLSAWEDVFTKGFIPELNKTPMTAGGRMTRVFDSRMLFSSVLAMAQKRDLMKATGDVATGTNLGQISEILLEMGEVHRARNDTELAQQVTEWLLTQGRRMKKGQVLTEQANLVFRTLSRTSQAWKYRSQMGTAFNAFEAMKTGAGWEAIGNINTFTKEMGTFDEAGKIISLGKKEITYPERYKIQTMEEYWKYQRANQRAMKHVDQIVDYDILSAQFNRYQKGMETAFGKARQNLIEQGIQHDPTDVWRQVIQSHAQAYKEETGRQSSKYIQEILAGEHPKTIREGAREVLGKGKRSILSHPLAWGIGAAAIYGGLLGVNRLMRDTPSVGEAPEPRDVGPYSLIATRADIVRASTIGKSEEEIIDWMKGGEPPGTPLVQTALETGTALHQIVEKRAEERGGVESSEKLVWDPANKIIGHYDIRYQTGEIEDIKTVSKNRWSQITREGPDWEHIQQVNFYGIMTNAPKVSIHYMQAENPNKDMVYSFEPSNELYEYSMAKVARARAYMQENGGAKIYSPLFAEYEEKRESLKASWGSTIDELTLEYMKQKEKYTQARKDYRQQKNERRFSAKDDAYNTIEGLRHGWFGSQRSQNVEFGSGYTPFVIDVLDTTAEIAIRQYFRKETHDRYGYVTPRNREALYAIEGLPHGWYGRNRKYRVGFGSRSIRFDNPLKGLDLFAKNLKDPGYSVTKGIFAKLRTPWMKKIVNFGVGLTMSLGIMGDVVSKIDAKSNPYFRPISQMSERIISPGENPAASMIRMIQGDPNVRASGTSTKDMVGAIKRELSRRNESGIILDRYINYATTEEFVKKYGLPDYVENTQRRIGLNATIHRPYYFSGSPNEITQYSKEIMLSKGKKIRGTYDHNYGGILADATLYSAMGEELGSTTLSTGVHLSDYDIPITKWNKLSQSQFSTAAGEFKLFLPKWTGNRATSDEIYREAWFTERQAIGMKDINGKVSSSYWHIDPYMVNKEGGRLREVFLGKEEFPAEGVSYYGLPKEGQAVAARRVGCLNTTDQGTLDYLHTSLKEKRAPSTFILPANPDQSVFYTDANGKLVFGSVNSKVVTKEKGKLNQWILEHGNARTFQSFTNTNFEANYLRSTAGLRDLYDIGKNELIAQVDAQFGQSMAPLIERFPATTLSANKAINPIYSTLQEGILQEVQPYIIGQSTLEKEYQRMVGTRGPTTLSERPVAKRKELRPKKMGRRRDVAKINFEPIIELPKLPVVPKAVAPEPIVKLPTLPQITSTLKSDIELDAELKNKRIFTEAERTHNVLEGPDKIVEKFYKDPHEPMVIDHQPINIGNGQVLTADGQVVNKTKSRVTKRSKVKASPSNKSRKKVPKQKSIDALPPGVSRARQSLEEKIAEGDRIRQAILDKEEAERVAKFNANAKAMDEEIKKKVEEVSAPIEDKRIAKPKKPKDAKSKKRRTKASTEPPRPASSNPVIESAVKQEVNEARQVLHELATDTKTSTGQIAAEVAAVTKDVVSKKSMSTGMKYGLAGIALLGGIAIINSMQSHKKNQGHSKYMSKG